MVAARGKRREELNFEKKKRKNVKGEEELERKQIPTGSLVLGIAIVINSP